MRARRDIFIILAAGTLMSAGAKAQAGGASADIAPGTERLAPWSAFIDEASLRFDIPRAWIEGVIMTESGGRTRLNGRPITSRAGAMGLMQVMPVTYEAMRIAQALGTDPYDPHDNILAGTAYLRAMYDRFGYPGLFGAYNAGPGRYEASLHGVRLPSETRTYLARLTKISPSIRSGNAIFVTQTTKPGRSETPRMSALFVPLNPQISAEN